MKRIPSIAMAREPVPFASDLIRHRSLLWQFTLRNVEIRHKGSHLGLVWSVLNPVLMLGCYVVVFGFIFGGKFGVLPNETKVDYALGIFFGLSLFQLVAEVLGVSPAIIVTNPNFVKKVVFPLEILPAAAVGGALFHMLISLSLVLLGVAIFGNGLDFGALWLPVFVAPLVLLTLGLSWFISALGVFFRDIGQLMQFVIMVLMYASAVFFSSDRIQQTALTAWKILRFNPLLLAIELSRDAVLWHRPVNFRYLAYLYISSLLACYLGHLAFRRMKPAFADVL
ncbi:MAG TPA: ABC transporter permease [Candidatus Didemnitutus sp.]|nr:ABC transporter permease [Candidatus Didemnitutus sp.]